MSEFTSFTHVEDTVEAVRLMADTQAAVIEALAPEATSDLFARFHVDFDEAEGCIAVVFRYKTDSTESTLMKGDYLVKLSTGRFVARTEEDFLKEYAAS